MDSNIDSVLPSGPQSFKRRHNGRSPVSEVFGFPVDQNQFSTLQSELPAVASQRPTVQREEGLVDPRTTRQLRWATRGTDDQEAKTEQATIATVNYSNTQGTVESGNCLNPGVSGNSSQFFHSFSAQTSDNFPLQSGELVRYVLDSGLVGGDTLYGDFKCNKRISIAGPEWSAGRPGHTPTRREFACVKHVEDSYAGQDWSAGRPGIRPFGARTAAYLSPQTACIGPYGTAALQQHYTGHNPL